MKIVLFSLGALLLVGGTAGWFWGMPATPEENSGPTNPLPQAAQVPTYQPPSGLGFVGSLACTECHADIAESYKSHPMSRSMEKMTPQTPSHVPPGERARVGETSRRYEVEFAEGEMRHHERMFDKSGAEIYDQAVPMQYCVGSGHRAKAYLHQRGDMLFMSPLNWYAAAGKWDLAPGYKKDDPRRFDRRATDQCLSCHAGRVNPEGRALNRYQDPPFHELSIGCENCHGPGADHIAFHASGDAAAAQDPIVNPAGLAPALRESVCQQCHLHGEARILRFGRSDFDFRPGMRFDDVWTVLVSDGEPQSKSQPHAVSQVQQMRASRCYQASEGRLGCISCHDPHRVPPADERIRFYRNKCLTCHQDPECGLPALERAKQENSCIACHMAAEKTSNIAHVAQTDHRVPKFRSAGNSAMKDTASGLAFFDEAHKRMEPWEQDRALGLGAIQYLAKTGQPLPPVLIRKLEQVLKTVPEEGAVLTALGAMALDHQRLDIAKSYFEKAQSLPDAKEAALSGLLKVHYLSGDWREALQCADWLVQWDAGNYRAQAMRADVLRHLEKPKEAILAAEESLRFNPTLIEVRELLVSLYRQSGQTERSLEQQQIITRMKESSP